MKFIRNLMTASAMALATITSFAADDLGEPAITFKSTAF